MRLSIDRWVNGGDFFNREPELRVLEARVRDGNHTLLIGQRRMGKTSIAQELGQRLEQGRWTFFFADVEDAACPEDFLADIVKATHAVRSLSARMADGMKCWFGEYVEEIDASKLRIKFRTGLIASG